MNLSNWQFSSYCIFETTFTFEILILLASSIILHKIENFILLYYLAEKLMVRKNSLNYSLLSMITRINVMATFSFCLIKSNSALSLLFRNTSCLLFLITSESVSKVSKRSSWLYVTWMTLHKAASTIGSCNFVAQVKILVQRLNLIS